MGKSILVRPAPVCSGQLWVKSVVHEYLLGEALGSTSRIESASDIMNPHLGDDIDMNSDFLIVGGDGDLAFRKLYPALYQLDVSACLPDGLRIICIARSDCSLETFIGRVRAKVDTHTGEHHVDENVWARFQARLIYAQADATSTPALVAFKQTYYAAESRDLIVYLATPAHIFAPVCQALQAAALVNGDTRIVVEKPLGSSKASFLEINAELSRIFAERQVYRIDHYLGKETVQNLLALRFSNSLFEPIWNNNQIDHVQITVAETVGVEGRWDFYDAAGTLKDMVQNHLLQLLCLVAMEPPAKLSADYVRDEKLKVLRCLKPMGRSDVQTNTVRGQYTAGAVNGVAVAGYTDEVGEKKKSNTETFVAIKAEINNWRWAGVPFYLRTGKRLPKRFSEIVIQLKDLPHSIFGEQSQGAPNRLIIRLQPDEGIQLEMMNKVPGLDATMPLQAVSLNLSYSQTFLQTRGHDAYERLLLDVIRGNSTLFVRADEVEAAWDWVDAIVDGWRDTKKSAAPYTAGSWGPSDAIALMARDGRSWRDQA